MIGVEYPEFERENIAASSSQSILNGSASEISLDGFEAKIPEYAFYRSITINTSQIDTIGYIYSKYAYQIGSVDIPLHKRIKICLDMKDEYIGDSSLYVASVGKNGALSFLGNKIVNGCIEAQTNVLGTYVIAKDTITPRIKPVNFRANGSISENWSLRVEIEDSETGINKYEMYVNGEWVLADFDAKNKLLIYQIDNHIKSGYNTFEVVVTDMVGNKSVYSTTLQR